jgi:hypothetical protein
LLDTASCDRPNGGIDLGDLGIGQLVRKIIDVSKIQALPRGHVDRPHRHRRHKGWFECDRIVDHDDVVL